MPDNVRARVDIGAIKDFFDPFYLGPREKRAQIMRNMRTTRKIGHAPGGEEFLRNQNAAIKDLFPHMAKKFGIGSAVEKEDPETEMIEGVDGMQVEAPVDPFREKTAADIGYFTKRSPQRIEKETAAEERTKDIINRREALERQSSDPGSILDEAETRPVTEVPDEGAGGGGSSPKGAVRPNMRDVLNAHLQNKGLSAGTTGGGAVRPERDRVKMPPIVGIVSAATPRDTEDIERGREALGYGNLDPQERLAVQTGPGGEASAAAAPYYQQEKQNRLASARSRRGRRGSGESPQVDIMKEKRRVFGILSDKQGTLEDVTGQSFSVDQLQKISDWIVRANFYGREQVGSAPEGAKEVMSIMEKEKEPEDSGGGWSLYDLFGGSGEEGSSGGGSKDRSKEQLRDEFFTN